MSHEAPSGWTTAQLASIAKCEMGETIIHKDLTGDGIPVFSASMDEHPWGWTSASRKRFRRGTIVIGARGSLGHPRLPNFDEFVSTQTTIAVHPSPAADPAFLLHALSAVDFENRGAKQAVPMLTVKAVNEVMLRLPPLPEQRRIAEVLKSVDEAIQTTQAVIDQTRTVKKGVLKNLLKRGVGQSDLQETQIGPIPEGWSIAPLQAYGSIVTGKTPSTNVPDYWGDGLPFITPGDLDDLIPDVVRAGRSVSESGSKTGKIVPAGSVLVTCIGSTIGKAGITQTSALTNQQINAICCQPEVSHFIYELVISLRDHLKNISGKQAVPLVNKSTFASILVPVPPKEEQIIISGIAASFSESLAACYHQIQRLREAKSALMEDLLSGRVRVSADLQMAAE